MNFQKNSKGGGRLRRVIFNPKIYVTDFGPGLFEHEIENNLQHEFPKMRGGDQRLFWTYPKIHPFWCGHPFLRDRPAQLAELPRSEFDKELFSHSAYVKFLCDTGDKSAVFNILRQYVTIFDIGWKWRENEKSREWISLHFPILFFPFYWPKMRFLKKGQKIREWSAPNTRKNEIFLLMSSLKVTVLLSMFYNSLDWIFRIGK